MKRTENVLAVIGLAIGAVFGISGSMAKDSNLQISLYEISSIGMIAASALLAMKYIRSENIYIATGFLLLAIAESVMSGGSAAGQVGGQPSFAAGMALYVPALLFIFIPKGFDLWIRIAGIVTTIPFLIAASKIFYGGQVLSTSALPGTGYGLLTVTFIGIIITLLRKYEA